MDKFLKEMCDALLAGKRTSLNLKNEIVEEARSYLAENGLEIATEPAAKGFSKVTISPLGSLTKKQLQELIDGEREFVGIGVFQYDAVKAYMDDLGHEIKAEADTPEDLEVRIVKKDVDHAARAHALLSASGAKQWLSCPPSARLEEKEGEPESSSPYAEEGTRAHELAEKRLTAYFNDMGNGYSKAMKQLKTEYPEDMWEHVSKFVDYCIEKYVSGISTDQCVVSVEKKVDFSAWVPEGYGTNDFAVIYGDTLEIVDLKYGQGIPVSAEGNPQLRLYALGALEEFGLLYDLSTVRMTIIQPRIGDGEPSTQEMTVDALYNWANVVVKPTAQLAWNGEGEFKAGDHCRFCKVKATCRHRADHNLELAKLDFKKPDLLEDDEIAEILERAEQLKKWAGDVQKYALDQAVNHAKSWPGLKLVSGKSDRKYSDEETVSAVLEMLYDEDMFKPRQLLSVAQLEKTLGKKEFNDLIGDLIIKPAGAPKLVPASDKRPEIGSESAARQDFSDLDGEDLLG